MKLQRSIELFQRVEGPYLFDVDGNRHIDHVLSWGPLTAGHAHPKVVEAVQRATAKGKNGYLEQGTPWSLLCVPDDRPLHTRSQPSKDRPGDS